MPGSKSNYLEKKYLDDTYGSGSPAFLYLALYLVAPGDDDTGTEVSEADYVRKAIANNTTNFPAAEGENPAVKSNALTILFDEAESAWGSIIAWALRDSASGGNMLHWATLTEAKVIEVGDTARFDPGDLEMAED